MTKPKIFYPGELRRETTIRIEGDELRYLRQVLRLNVGDEIGILNGNSGCLPAVITGMSSCCALALVTGDGEGQESTVNITLAQALVKGNKMDSLVEKAAELGVARIIPFVAARSIPHLEKERARARRERWQKVARESARQVGRGAYPLIDEVTTFSQMLSRSGSDEQKIILWEEEKHSRIHDLFRNCSRWREFRFFIVVGPEGGFSAEEATKAKEQGFLSISLGRQVFKVETALIAAVTIINYEADRFAVTDKEEETK